MSDLGGFSLFELFKAEAETHGATLDEGLLRLEEDPTDVSAIEPLMRAAHSLKGAARIIGVDLAVRLAHAMEDCLVAVQKGQETLVPARVDQLLAGTDLLKQLGKISESELPAFNATNESAVDALVESLRHPAEAAPAPKPTESSTRVEPPAVAGPATTEPSAQQPSAEPAPAEKPAPPAESPPASATPASPESPSPALEASPPPAKREAPAASPAPPTSPPTARRAAAKPATEVKTLRVNADNLDRMMRLAGEMMIESRRFQTLRESVRQLKQELEGLEDRLEESSRRFGGDPRAVATIASMRESIGGGRRTLLGHASDLENMFRRTEEVATALYHEVIGSRMRPFADGAAGLPRMVRDLAKGLGKQVRFEMLGGTVPVDRDILAKLEAPLNHMLRNCVDHGVEMPQERVDAGKDPTARVFLEARHHGGMLMVRVGDDGRGIDPERIRRKIVEKGLQNEAVAAGLSKAELLDFLFLPGFSTAGKVTEISGRGVGLDVVQTMVQETGGSLRVETEPGQGAAFSMRLPITLSVIRAALVEIDGEPYAFPLSRLERVVKVPRESIKPVEGRQQFELDGVSVGLINARSILGLGGSEAAGDVSSVMVIGSVGEWFGLVVDRFLGEEDLVVRPLDPRLGRVPHVASAALLEDGRPLLIVDTDDLVASVRQLLGEGRLRGTRTGESGATRRRKRVLVVEDSITVREVERQLLLRMGYDVEVAVDGVDGWNALQQGGYDLVVSDIDMPRMNGIEFVKTLRKDERFRRIPVIIVSYKDREEDRLRGMEAGANAYLTKGSFHDRSFATMVEDLIGAAERPA
ncbi:MAG: hybrid sensor histidine kinase/response regulator [Phycisphaerales bacterium]